ncbi:MAG: hypothetical protein ABSC53_09185 [Bacteroidota bacterium]
MTRSRYTGKVTTLILELVSGLKATNSLFINGIFIGVVKRSYQ